jgi:hypothetical protein
MALRDVVLVSAVRHWADLARESGTAEAQEGDEQRGDVHGAEV